MDWNEIELRFACSLRFIIIVIYDFYMKRNDLNSSFAANFFENTEMKFSVGETSHEYHTNIGT